VVKAEFCSFSALFIPNSNHRAKKAIPLPDKKTADQEYDLGLFFQTNKPTVGEARQSDNNAVAAKVVLSSRWLVGWQTESAAGTVH
jgi:hypothetical protein